MRPATGGSSQRDRDGQHLTGRRATRIVALPIRPSRPPAVDAVAAGAVIVVFGLIGTGVAMLVGSVASNPEQASSIGVGAAMLLGAFGGAMVPPEVFPDVMRTVSHLTPHAWAIDALREAALRDGDIVAIAPQLAVLFGFAAVLLVLATVRFRRVLQV